MHIGLYFGSFNPVHTGHLIIANHIRNVTNLQEIWLIISPQNPFKNPRALLNEQHRLHLLRLAVQDDLFLKVSNVEFALPRPSYTINTLTYLREKYPDREFVLIMGSDSFKNFPSWKNAEKITRDHQIYIYPRPGFEIDNTIQARITIVDAPLLEISSTHIRELVAGNKSIRYLVPDIVREEITSQHYYSTALENPAKKKTG